MGKVTPPVRGAFPIGAPDAAPRTPAAYRERLLFCLVLAKIPIYSKVLQLHYGNNSTINP